MAASGVINAGMLGLQTARFEKLELYDPLTNGYFDVADAMEYLRQEIGAIGTPIAADTARIDALEIKVQTLDEQKATKFEAVVPLVLDESTFPQSVVSRRAVACCCNSCQL